MAVPKCKVSKKKGRSRSANWKLSTPNMSECSQCHELKLSHVVCPKCGYYNGKPVVIAKEKKAE